MAWYWPVWIGNAIARRRRPQQYAIDRIIRTWRAEGDREGGMLWRIPTAFYVGAELAEALDAKTFAGVPVIVEGRGWHVRIQWPW